VYKLALLGVVAYVIWAWFKHAARQATDRADRTVRVEASGSRGSIGARFRVAEAR
jgi:hypothetical protein